MSILDATKRYLFNIIGLQSSRWANIKTDVNFATGTNTGLTANGNTIASTLILSSAYNQISTCTGGNVACRLQTLTANGTAVDGVVTVVRNDGVAPLLVFPTTVLQSINALAVGNSYSVPPGGTQTFTFRASLNAGAGGWFTGSSDNAGQVVTVAAITTLTAAQSNSTVLVSQAGAYTITLPAVQAGLRFTFILNNAAANVVQIAASAGTPIQGSAVVGPDAGATINRGAGVATVRYSTTCVLGDRIDMFSDGTNWYVTGVSGSNVAATGIIFA